MTDGSSGTVLSKPVDASFTGRGPTAPTSSRSSTPRSATTHSCRARPRRPPSRSLKSLLRVPGSSYRLGADFPSARVQGHPPSSRSTHARPQFDALPRWRRLDDSSRTGVRPDSVQAFGGMLSLRLPTCVLVWLSSGLRARRAPCRSVAPEGSALLVAAMPARRPNGTTGSDGKARRSWRGCLSGSIPTSCRRRSRWSTTGRRCWRRAGSAPTRPAMRRCGSTWRCGRIGPGRWRAATAPDAAGAAAAG